ncbi:MAG: DUF1489 family protein [Aurantimonas endophytica]|uniref:DUF1489 family protein n=1 Tax=Aurantimonas endophytica TaxID=1522175 RepID=UPI0030034926
MPLHLIKLCVGVETVDELEAYVAARLDHARATGAAVEQIHTTRMVPKRAAELADGGSLYWVIKGHTQVRQRLLAIRPFVDEAGIGRCRLVLEPVFTRTAWQPRRAFQGWRYLKPEEAPMDLGGGETPDEALPPALSRELFELGLL